MIAEGKRLAEIKPPSGAAGRFTVQADERDKFRAAAEGSLLIRAGLPTENIAPGSHDLTGYSLRELARETLRYTGRPVGGNPMEMVGRAMLTSGVEGGLPVKAAVLTVFSLLVPTRPPASSETAWT